MQKLMKFTAALATALALGGCGAPDSTTEGAQPIENGELVASPESVALGRVAVGAEAERQAAAILAGPSFTLGIELGDGPGRARYLTSDLGHTYVDVNAGYRS